MATKKTTSAPAAYEVGRGKPPRSSQFKPGQSGNPGGRKKGSVNLKTIMTAVLESEIELTENGRKRRVPLLEAIILRQAQDALRGQLRAIDSLLDRYERHAGHEVKRPDELPEEDLVLLERVLGPSRRHDASNVIRRSDNDGLAEEGQDHD
ncbi:DUF5681 domain-containing protein [Microvirga arsenatis]|uniref:DUF5681 domain-containing protein n=1 Tax=Microvirga arsenatis TaxID=2692265 RepID=A0ABW9YUW5_9HYPH|nr:DUF5681 domain-containing protein [Microvirga arsenatis]NBJ10914.1 hypothetical protein [Microvirga arsenatis]NBJ24188.1 hypothetical protein [Microvirga arsenatis]